MPNPILPLWEHIPDGEPRLFDGRVYLYGSHDRAFSDSFCDSRLKVWSAPLDDLNQWVCHGDAFLSREKPGRERDVTWLENGMLYAPDALKIGDRYYLFVYVFYGRGCVAASDRPDKKRLNAIPEALGFNRYPGWYQLDAYGMSALIDEICEKNERGTVALTEYGAGAGISTHGHVVNKVRPSGEFHPMEYQAFVHCEDWRLLRRDSRVWGAFVWCMYDFGSDCRREGEKFGINDKGLVAFDHRTRKDAYWFYRANWTDDPVLHLVGSPSRTAAGPVQSILVFSNVGNVTLEVNGRIVGEMEPDDVKSCHWRDVRLDCGNNVVTVRAGGIMRTAFWRNGECSE